MYVDFSLCIRMNNFSQLMVFRKDNLSEESIATELHSQCVRFGLSISRSQRVVWTNEAGLTFCSILTARHRFGIFLRLANYRFYAFSRLKPLQNPLSKSSEGPIRAHTEDHRLDRGLTCSKLLSKLKFWLSSLNNTCNNHALFYPWYWKHIWQENYKNYNN